MPVFENPSYNGIITNEIISNLTKENLEIISSENDPENKTEQLKNILSESVKSDKVLN